MGPVSSREAVNSGNYTPIVNIVTWILLVSMVFAVCTKVAMKIIGRRTFNIDDSILVAAMTVSAAQSTAFCVQAYNGVGRPFRSLAISQVARYEKAGYAADLLYVIALAISKVSILVLLWQITPVAVHRRLTLGVGSFIAIWTLAFFFASAFQCSVPNTWTILSQHCFDRTSFWTAYGIINILTEAVLILLPTYIIWNLHMTGERKAVVLSCFAVRVLVMGAIIAQLTLLNQERDSDDVTLDRWPYYLSVQFVQSLSVIIACVPYIKNVLVGVESGMFQTGHFGLATLQKSPHRTQEQGSSAARSGKATPTGTSGVRTNQSQERGSRTMVTSAKRQTNPFSAENTATAEPVTPVEDWDDNSQSSRTKIIKETREWHVNYEV